MHGAQGWEVKLKDAGNCRCLDNKPESGALWGHNIFEELLRAALIRHRKINIAWSHLYVEANKQTKNPLFFRVGRGSVVNTVVNNMVLCALKFIENRPCIKCYHKIRITTTKGHKETRKCWYAFYFDCGDGIMRVCRYPDSSNCIQLICSFYVNYY